MSTVHVQQNVHITASEQFTVRASSRPVHHAPPPPYQHQPAPRPASNVTVVTTEGAGNVTVTAKPASNVTVQAKPVTPVFGFMGVGGTSQRSSTGGKNDCNADTTYIRSLEGIMKIVSIPVVVIGLVLSAIGYLAYGGWFIFIGVGYLFYVGVVLVVETFIPNRHFHKLYDAVIMGISGLLWAITAIAALAIAVQFKSAWVGIGMVFAVACCGLCIAGTVFAIQTYRRNGGNGWAPSKPIIKAGGRRATTSDPKPDSSSDTHSDAGSV